jgi:hypothetical protein
MPQTKITILIVEAPPSGVVSTRHPTPDTTTFPTGELSGTDFPGDRKRFDGGHLPILRERHGLDLLAGGLCGLIDQTSDYSELNE